MAGYFTDSSAVVKRYVQEIGSAWVENLFSAMPGNEIAIVEITCVEVVSAITRRSRGGTITITDANVSCNLFLADLNTDYQIIAVTDILLRQAIYLARTHGLRGYDAVQLAAGLEVNRLSNRAKIIRYFTFG